MHPILLDAAGHRRQPVTVPGYHAGRPPRNKGRRYPADPPTVEEIIAVMRTAGAGADGVRLRALIVLLWRAGLRIGEALALAETDLDRRRGAVLIRHGKGDKRREVGMDSWAWEQLEPWRQLRVRFPVGPLLCVIHGRIWSNGAARRSSCRPVSLLARCGTTLTAGCQFRFRLEARMCLGRGLAPAARSGDQRSTATGAAWRSRMIAPSRPDGRSPGPIGPDRFSPTGGNFRRAALAATDMWLSCHSRTPTRPRAQTALPLRSKRWDRRRVGRRCDCESRSWDRVEDQRHFLSPASSPNKARLSRSRPRFR